MKKEGNKTGNKKILLLLPTILFLLSFVCVAQANIETLRPNADGDLTEWLSPGSPITHWDRVDEVTPDDDSTYIRDQWCNNPIYLTVKENNVVSYSSGISTSSSWSMKSNTWTTRPSDNSNWTVNDINSLQIGVRTVRRAGGDYKTDLFNLSSSSIPSDPAINSTINSVTVYARAKEFYEYGEYRIDVTQVYVEVNYTLEDTTPPTRSNSFPTGNLSLGTTQTTISLNTNETATCKYSITVGTEYPSMIDTFDNTESITHSTLVTDLSDWNTYTYYVRCNDTSGNYNTDDFLISFGISEILCGPADTNTDGVVSMIELMNDIANWKSGSVTMVELMTAIGEWKNGC